MSDSIECHLHPDRRAVGDLEIGLDSVAACVVCAAQAIYDDRFAVDYFPDVPFDIGEGAVVALVEQLDAVAA